MTPRTLVLLVAVGTGSRADQPAGAQPMQVVPVERAELKPLDPANPGGARMAVLRGDPATGPSTLLLEVGRGGGRLHAHTADYEAVVIEGEMKHWASGSSVAEALVLSRGSWWFQPGGGAHADLCLSERCLMVVTFAGPRDARLVEER